MLADFLETFRLNRDPPTTVSDSDSSHHSSISERRRRVSIDKSQVPYYQSIISSGAEWSTDSEETHPGDEEDLDIVEHFDTNEDKVKHEAFMSHRAMHYRMREDLRKARELLEKEEYSES